MIRIAKIFSLLFTLLLLGACNTTQTRSGDAPVLSRIAHKGELVLGTSANMEPMNYRREDGKVVGLDIDIARFMAEAMGVKLTIKTLPFDQLLPALQRGDVDVVLSNMTITTKRNMKAAFVGPYMTSGKCIITRNESLAKAEQAADLNTPATRMVVMKGSTSEQFVKALLPKATITLVDDPKAGVELVREDQVGGMLTDLPICLATLRDNPDAGFVSLVSLLSYEPIGIALPPNDPLLVNWTENFLARMDATGILDEIGVHWFGPYAAAIKPLGAEAAGTKNGKGKKSKTKK